MDEATRADGEVHDPMSEWRDPPGIGRTVMISSSIGVVLSLVLITLGMMAAGQVWQSALALGAFIAFWGGLGFGSMIGGVVYLTRLDEAAKALEAEGADSRRARSLDADAPVIAPSAAAIGAPDVRAADAA